MPAERTITKGRIYKKKFKLTNTYKYDRSTGSSAVFFTPVNNFYFFCFLKKNEADNSPPRNIIFKKITYSKLKDKINNLDVNLDSVLVYFISEISAISGRSRSKTSPKPK